MRTFAVLLVVVLLAAVTSGCPLRRAETKSAPPRLSETAAPNATEAAPSAEESPSTPAKSPSPAEAVPIALREAREEDLPILTPILDYLKSKAVDEEISGLKDMRWLCVDDVAAGKVSDEDPKNLTVIYKIVPEENWTAVRVGPPKSEFDLEFRVTKKEDGGYMYVGWETMPSPGES